MAPMTETKPDLVTKELERMQDEFQQYTEEYSLGFERLEALDLWGKWCLTVVGVALGFSGLYVLYYHRLWILVFLLLIAYEAIAVTHQGLQKRRVKLVKASHIGAVEILRSRARFLWENQMIDDATLERLLRIGADSHAKQK